jgi:putative phosphoribosyl transferase
MSGVELEFSILRDVLISSDRARLEGELMVPEKAIGILLFPHGYGSSRHSPPYQDVARTLHEFKIGTLLFDLLTADEEDEEQYTRHLRFDIGLLARRFMDVTRWLKAQPGLGDLPVGFFGASTGAAAALVAAAELKREVVAVVSRGGRADLGGAALARVEAPTLLIVGERDEPVIKLNRDAYAQLHCKKRLEIIKGASHLFVETGALEEAAKLAAKWFSAHLRAA